MNTMYRKTVLVVDDHEDSRIICGTILQHHGYRFLEAGDGEAAVQLVHAERPDMVLLDISLPVMDGYEVAALLRKGEETAGIPLIALTAQALAEDRDRVLTAGFDAYLAKPCSPSRVLMEVERFIGPAAPSEIGGAA
jgi:two-component system cell cycle response regulator DivK